MEQRSLSLPFVTPILDGAVDDMIALLTSDYRIYIPAPPWSTMYDFLSSSRTGAWGPAIPRDVHEGAEYITWNESVSGRMADFHITPASEPADNFRRQYDVKVEPFIEARFQPPSTGSDAQPRLVLSEHDRRCWIMANDSPFGMPKTYLQAVCVLRVADDLVSLSHSEAFETFDTADTSQWPVPVQEMEQRARRLTRMIAVSLTP